MTALASPYADHPYADHLSRVAAAPAHAAWRPEDGPLPSLYLGHGAPVLLEDRLWMRQLHDWARALPRPRAVLVVSAHWESAPLSISTTTVGAPLVHDHSGFDPAYRRLRYATPDASALARAVAAVLPDGEVLHEHASRGLDHGAWVPLLAMYPEADVPVLQLSLPSADGGRLLALGARLRALREEGVLVLGSGFLTHGLPYVDWHRPDHVPAWSSEFDAWAAEALARGDVDELAQVRTRAPGMPYAHPTLEHFTPLFVTLGAARDPGAGVTTTVDGWFLGLSKRSFQAA